VRASQSSRSLKSSWSEKSSQYNRKRASRARHTSMYVTWGAAAKLHQVTWWILVVVEFYTISLIYK